MAFTRGNDAKETLGLGVFSPIVKELRRYFDEDVLNRKSYWNMDISREISREYDPGIDTPPVYKNIPDGSGGNCHKFLVLLQSQSIDPLISTKQLLRSISYSIRSVFRKLGCKPSDINFYIERKYPMKYGMKMNEDSKVLLVEIIYSKKS